ncbi:N(alpha)-acetyltransferase 20, NatB catalytic subunit [Mycoemilia scoparia]|uniref:N(Alpha)-acetyltransferase 20, NatB catalytic subunit n=1 Tax=Mycoemilia scoparia TaxID=417184 RepID=A0A9W8DX43_9FUNG|nr:N(alpha)-acetyltransferase 20, NatB catalytic subunit [Mycoemilia scoparia]
MVSTSEKSTASGSGILNDVYQSIFQPGEVNDGVLKVMNGAFIGLFVILSLLVYGTGGSWHVIALLFIAVGLFVSVQWFISEFKKIEVQKNNEKKDESKESASSTGSNITRKRNQSSAASRKPKRLNLDFFTETYDITFYLKYIATWPDIFNVAETPNGNLMGYVMGKVEGKGENWHGHVTALTVGPEYRRLGLGKTLMHFLEDASEKM